MKKKQTAKYKKRHKKEVTNRKAKQQAVQHEQSKTVPVVKPDVSPARRAFQDV